MKKTILLFPAVILMLAGCARDAANPIEGAWNLVYAVQYEADVISWEFPADIQGSSIKMWTKEHFIFVGQGKTDTAVFDNYGGGTYSLDGNMYLENIEYLSSKEEIGMSVRMHLEVVNDTLIQKYPVNDAGQTETGNYRIEKYVKLE